MNAEPARDFVQTGSSAPDTSNMIPFSDFTTSGALPMPEIVGPIFDEGNEKCGNDVEPTWK